MQKIEAKTLFTKGLQALAENKTPTALTCFEKASQIEQSPTVTSCLAFCLAKERGQLKRAISLCEEAIAIEPDNTIHYLNLGKILILAGDKLKALEVLRKSLELGDDPQILVELNRLGTRKPPIFTFLPREHPINKYIGIILGRLRLR